MLTLVVGTLAATWNRPATGQASPLGPYAADFLLGPGGALDGTGAGARSLATGGEGFTITTAATCFGSLWCGTLVVTAEVLLAAYKRFLEMVTYSMPGTGTWTTWYQDARYYFRVLGLAPEKYDASYCGVRVSAGTPSYYFYTSTAVVFEECGQLFGQWPWFSNRMAEVAVRSAFSKFRGMNGVAPGVATPGAANAWVQGQIDAGHWAVVKPHLDAVVRTAATWEDLANLGLKRKVWRIAVDAGHGRNCPPGEEEGTTGPTYGDQERVLVLDIARQAAAVLRARGHVAFETRPTEQCVSLDERVMRARRNGAEIFVSIHLNAALGTVPNPFGGSRYNPNVRGTEAWYDPRRPATAARSLALAQLVVNTQVGLGLPTHGAGKTGIPGIKLASGAGAGDGGPFYVLSLLSWDMPAVLDEVAFLTNPQEESLSHDPSFRQRAGNAISDAIVSFLSQR